MRVQIKLLIVTLALVTLIIAATGALFFRYNEDTCIERSMTQMKALADTIALQMESRVRQMDFALLFMMSEPDFLQSISYYTMPGRASEANRLLVSNSAAVISRVMINYAVNKNFYRASLFTTNGDYFSSRFLEQSPSGDQIVKRLNGINWTNRARSMNGRALLLEPYIDPWSDEAREVYAVVRALQTTSGSTCFIEIQNQAFELDELLASARVFEAKADIMLSDGKAFYRADDDEISKDDIVAVSETNAYGLFIRVWQSRAAALEMPGSIKTQVFALCAIALVLSAAYLYFASRRITKPLSAIRASMDETAIDTLTNPPLPTGGDELQTLNEAFLRLCERLKNAIDELLQSQERETRARFDSLQAQIDPHFLCNTLNVIAGRAMATGDDEIVSTCEEIASMLRYSTDTKNRYSTIGLEADHLSTYLALMKKRYKQKLEYSINVAPEIVDRPMPKIVLQQFAENAIRHGFDGATGVLRLVIDVITLKDGWEIRVSDNGSGFDEDVLSDLRRMIDDASPNREVEGLSIGGMGIVNTYLRLKAFYGDSFSLKLSNSRQGAVVILSWHKTE